MSSIKEVLVPDLGGVAEVDVIEVLVKPGDKIAAEDSLITLESDKATMDVPAPFAGIVKAVRVKAGDKVSEGDGVLSVEVEGEESAVEEKAEPVAEVAKEQPAAKTTSAIVEIKVPDVGTDSAVDVIEVSIKAGDTVALEDTLIVLESDKATMDVPSDKAGKITEVKVKVGDKVHSGDVIALAEGEASEAAVEEKAAPAQVAEKPAVEKATVEKPTAPATSNSAAVHAGPAVRRLADQLGVDLAKVTGTGRKSRIQLEDVHKFVKQVMQSGGAASGSGLNLLPPPQVDFEKFGSVEVKPLSRIQKISGANLQRNWVTVPHVTQFDEADITEMEAFRQANKKEAEKLGAKLTPLIFIMKAAVASLKAYPVINSSLSNDGESLIMKQYFHIGVAVDTPNGLVVPVVRDVDQKSFLDLAVELGEISKKAREGKLLPKDMQGGCFTISSLGGIGGTAFTPIVNMPEVAILGVSRSEIKPKFIDGEFQPRLALPLSFSYDHRVIDGALAARFTTHLSAGLSDLRRLLL